MLLDADTFDRARRRVSELPGQSGSVLKVRPEADGFATVDRRRRRAAGDSARRGGVDRHGRAGGDRPRSRRRRAGHDRPGRSLVGELALVEASARASRLASRRRAPAGCRESGVSTDRGRLRPTRAAIPGAAAADPADAQPRRADGERLALGQCPLCAQRRARFLERCGDGSLLRPPREKPRRSAVRSSAGSGAIASRSRRTASRWMSIGAGSGFGAAGVQALARSSNETRGWVYPGTAGAERVSDNAPLGLWPGAGDGRARPPLARAHPLLDDGVISTAGSSIFGRTLAYGSVEARRWLERPALIRIAPAGFVDVARASRRGAGGRRSGAGRCWRGCADQGSGRGRCAPRRRRARAARWRDRRHPRVDAVTCSAKPLGKRSSLG